MRPRRFQLGAATYGQKDSKAYKLDFKHNLTHGILSHVSIAQAAFQGNKIATHVSQQGPAAEISPLRKQDKSGHHAEPQHAPNSQPKPHATAMAKAHLSERTMGRPSGSGGNGFSSGAPLFTLASSVLSGLPLAATANASRLPGSGTLATVPGCSCLLSLKMAPPLYTSPGESPCCGLRSMNMVRLVQVIMQQDPFCRP